MRLDVDVNGTFGGAPHGHQDGFAESGGFGIGIGAGANLHQPRTSARDGFERVATHDVARARAADKTLYPSVGEDQRTVSEMRADRRATLDDRSDRVGRARTLEPCGAFEELARVHAFNRR